MPTVYTTPQGSPAPVIIVPPVIIPPVIIVPPGYSAIGGAVAPLAPAAAAAPQLPPAVAVASPASAPLIASPLAAEDDNVIQVSGSAASVRSLSPSPTTILTRSHLLGSGLINLGEVLQRLPSQGNAINGQANNGGEGTTRVSLRSLGASRTLTLINGRNVVPSGTGADSSVDLGTIPMAIIERVEIIKDGDSATYGSGAIGGVVNIVTRKGFDGTEASLYTGTSDRGDGARYDASVATGLTSSKGNLTFAASFQSQEHVMAGDRELSAFDKDYDYENQLESNIGSSSIPGGRLNTRALDSNGDGRADAPINVCGLTSTGTPIQYCRNDGGRWVPFITPGDFYNYQPENYLVTPAKRFNAFATGERELKPGVRGFFEASFSHAQTDQRLAPEPFISAAPISAQSVYNPLGVTVLGYNRRLVEFGPRASAQEVDAFRIVAGVKGSLSERLDGWSWELSYNFGRSNATQTNDGNLVVDRLTKALGPSFFDANGVPRCGTVGNEIYGCVPLNILAGAAANAVTPEMIDYVGYTGISKGYNQQQILLAQLSGKLSDSLSLTVSADHRRDAGGYTPDSRTADGDTTGNSGSAVDGEINVTEAMAAASFSALADDEGRKRLQLDASARAFRYDVGGSGAAWKLGAIFRPVSGVAVRATSSKAYRAPSISELFSAAADSFPQVDDPCDTWPPSSSGPITLPPDVAARCAAQGVPADAVFGTAQQRARVGGNKNLEAESAKVLTAGVALEPARGLSVTADYFRTEASKTVQSRGASVILYNCYYRGIQSDCDKVFRDPALGGQIDYVDDTVANSGVITTSGVDAALAYEHSSGKSHFNHLIDATYLIEHKIDDTLVVREAKGNYDFGVFPELKINLSSQWQYENLGFGGNLRFISSYTECAANDCNGLLEPVPSPGSTVADIGGGAGAGAAAPTDEYDVFRRTVDQNVTVDLFGSYSMKSLGGNTLVTVGVNNVFDQAPSLIYSGFAGDSDSSTYDYMGRFFYARLTQQF